VKGKDLNLGDIGTQMTGRLKGELKISLLQKFGDLSRSAQLPIKMDVAVNLPVGFILYDFYELFGVLMLHAAFDFFQSHLPQILNCHGSSGESKD
jgi:hypothetical protein